MRQDVECEGQMGRAENVRAKPGHKIKDVKKSNKQKSGRIMETMEKWKAEYATTPNVKPKGENGEQTLGNPINISGPFSVSADYVSTIHSYARTAGKCVILKYECVKCRYKTDRKCNYDDHISGCGRKRDKTLKCPICENNFTYGTLRHHLHHFASGKHRTVNQHHSKYTPKDHQQLLEHIKTLKKCSKFKEKYHFEKISLKMHTKGSPEFLNYFK